MIARGPELEPLAPDRPAVMGEDRDEQPAERFFVYPAHHGGKVESLREAAAQLPLAHCPQHLDVPADRARCRSRLGLKAARALAEVVDKGKEAQPLNLTLVQVAELATSGKPLPDDRLPQQLTKRAGDVDAVIDKRVPRRPAPIVMA